MADGSIVEMIEAMDQDVLTMSGIYISFQPYSQPTVNILNGRMLKSISKGAETYDQEEIMNVVSLGRAKKFLSGALDPGTVTIQSYFDLRKGVIAPPVSRVTSYAKVGDGMLYLCRVIVLAGGEKEIICMFACEANVQTCNTFDGEFQKSVGTTTEFKLSGEPAWNEDSEEP